ncbi:hypothetical protein MHYMCMPSP_01044, partial [Hyalomma marginatum]
VVFNQESAVALLRPIIQQLLIPLCQHTDNLRQNGSIFSALSLTREPIKQIKITKNIFKAAIIFMQFTGCLEPLTGIAKHRYPLFLIKGYKILSLEISLY